MNKLTSIWALAILVLACSPSFAADLGQARVRSQRGEPLVVDVPLVFEGKDESDTISIVATGSDAASAGASHIALAHELRRLDNGRYVVRLTSADPVSVAKLTLWVMAESAYGKASRNFQLPLRAASSASAAETSTTPARSAATAVRPSSRLTAGSLAAMNASLDEEAQRIRAVVARQRQDMLAQVNQIETQRRQLAQIGGQSQIAAEVTAKAQAQLNQRSEALRGLQDDLNEVIGPTGGHAPAVDKAAGQDGSEIQAVTSAAVTRDADVAQAISQAPSAPTRTETTASTRTSEALAVIPARHRAVPTPTSEVASADTSGDPLVWWVMSGLAAGLAGTVYIERRKRLAAAAQPHDDAQPEARRPAWPAALEHLHMDPGFTDAASCAKPLKDEQRTWAEASGLTDNLIQSMRRSP
jgi:hypothetical protein